MSVSIISVCQTVVVHTFFILKNDKVDLYFVFLFFLSILVQRKPIAKSKKNSDVDPIKKRQLESDVTINEPLSKKRNLSVTTMIENAPVTRRSKKQQEEKGTQEGKQGKEKQSNVHKRFLTKEEIRDLEEKELLKSIRALSKLRKEHAKQELIAYDHHEHPSENRKALRSMMRLSKNISEAEGEIRKSGAKHKAFLQQTIRDGMLDEDGKPIPERDLAVFNDFDVAAGADEKNKEQEEEEKEDEEEDEEEEEEDEDEEEEADNEDEEEEIDDEDNEMTEEEEKEMPIDDVIDIMQDTHMEKYLDVSTPKKNFPSIKVQLSRDYHILTDIVSFTNRKTGDQQKYEALIIRRFLKEGKKGKEEKGKEEKKEEGKQEREFIDFNLPVGLLTELLAALEALKKERTSNSWGGIQPEMVGHLDFDKMPRLVDGTILIPGPDSTLYHPTTVKMDDNYQLSVSVVTIILNDSKAGKRKKNNVALPPYEALGFTRLPSEEALADAKKFKRDPPKPFTLNVSSRYIPAIHTVVQYIIEQRQKLCALHAK